MGGFLHSTILTKCLSYASPNDNKVIGNACESNPFKVEKNVTKQGKFWTKGQPYNIQFLLANDSLVDSFVGGTVYQGLL